MKFLHTGDLHIGKMVHEFSMIEEQKHILEQIVKTAKRKKVDAVVIAGDIYDRSLPGVEAVLVLDYFLTSLIKENIAIIMISGNHDSPERIQFANQILEKQGLTIAGDIADGKLKQLFFEDQYGKICFTLLPFVKPAVVDAKNSQEAVEKLLKATPIQNDKSTRNVCVAHYFVTSGGKTPELSDSETSINIGGLDNIEAATFDSFDYVALGHIHKAQKIGEGKVYYAGTPLKYSFSEVNQQKSVQLVTLKEKGKLQVEQVCLEPLHDMRKIKGTLEQLLDNDIVTAANATDYIQATILNEEELIDPIGTLRSVYPNTMQLILAKNLKQENSTMDEQIVKIQQARTTLELFDDFYELVKGQRMDEARQEVVIDTIKEAEE